MTYIWTDGSFDWFFSFKRGTLVSIGDFVDFDSIINKLDCVLEAVPECRVAWLIDKLVVPHKETLLAAFALVPSDIISPPVVTRESSLHALTLRDVKLVWSDATL